MTDSKKNIRLMFVGDINLGEYYTSFGHGPKTFIKSQNPFAKVLDTLAEADLVIGNLEAALTDKNLIPNEPESAVLRGSPSDAHLLVSANFRVLQVANNHTVQHGDEGFDQTVSTLKANGIEPVGLNNQPVTVIEVRGVRLGFIAASDVPDNTNREQNKYQRLNEDFLKRVESGVIKVDHLFVLLHWGLEASTEKMAYQDELAFKLKNMGVRGVIGHHPHLFYEVFNDTKFVFAPSLGNFLFDLAWDPRLIKSGILDILISDDHVQSSIWPVLIEKNGCLPSITGDRIFVEERLKIYDLGVSMDGEQTRKTKYFLKNLFKGDTKLKFKFFLRKLLPFLKKSQLS